MKKQLALFFALILLLPACGRTTTDITEDALGRQYYSLLLEDAEKVESVLDQSKLVKTEASGELTGCYYTGTEKVLGREAALRLDLVNSGLLNYYEKVWTSPEPDDAFYELILQTATEIYGDPGETASGDSMWQIDDKAQAVLHTYYVKGDAARNIDEAYVTVLAYAVDSQYFEKEWTSAQPSIESAVIARDEAGYNFMSLIGEDQTEAFNTVSEIDDEVQYVWDPSPGMDNDFAIWEEIAGRQWYTRFYIVNQKVFACEKWWMWNAIDDNYRQTEEQMLAILTDLYGEPIETSRSLLEKDKEAHKSYWGTYARWEVDGKYQITMDCGGCFAISDFLLLEQFEEPEVYIQIGVRKLDEE